MSRFTIQGVAQYNPYWCRRSGRPAPGTRDCGRCTGAPGRRPTRTSHRRGTVSRRRLLLCPWRRHRLRTMAATKAPESAALDTSGLVAVETIIAIETCAADCNNPSDYSDSRHNCNLRLWTRDSELEARGRALRATLGDTNAHMQWDGSVIELVRAAYKCMQAYNGASDTVAVLGFPGFYVSTAVAAQFTFARSPSPFYSGVAPE